MLIQVLTKSDVLPELFGAYGGALGQAPAKIARPWTWALDSAAAGIEP